MGSSQSRPSTPQDPPIPRSGFRRRLEPLRRLSTLGRRKRDRSTSASSPTPEEGNDDASITALASTGTATDPVLSETNRTEEPVSPQNTRLVVSRTLSPSPAPSIHYPVRRPPSPINSPISVRRPSQSRSTNERVVALRRTLHIPEWNTSVNVSRRRSWAPESESGPSSAGNITSTAPGDLRSTPNITATVPSSSTDALLTSPGSINTTTTTSANTFTSTNPLPPRSPTPPPVLHRTRSEPANGNTLLPLPTPSPENQVRRLRVEQGFLGEEVALLRQQLEVSRRELAQAVTDAADAESNLRELENEGGAVMMIQGIAQTHIPIVSRRVMGRWRRERERRVPFEEQASTIIGLILVASLATANTLLSTERPRPRPNTILETLMRRIHPTRAFAVETLLADPSISQSPRSNRRRSTGTQSTDSGMENLDMPSEFTDWLNTLQSSIREAMREFVEGTTLPLSRTTSAQHTEVERPGAGRRVSAPVIQGQATINDLVHGPEQGAREPAPEETSDSQQSTSHHGNSSLEVPRFHIQPGQTPPSQNRTGVTTDANGTRRLNFFRAHIFAAPNDDPNAVVPCLFVGVRSTTQDPATFGETGGHPFSDPPQPIPSSPNGGPERDPAQAQVRTPSPPTSPLEADEPTSSDGELLPTVYRSRLGRVTSSPSHAGEARPTYDRNMINQTPSSPNGGAERASRVQALRSRLLALSPFSSHQRASDSQTEAPEHLGDDRPTEPEPQATFVMYVIGGNFPRNHPVLRIPGLITGEPLSDEEMVLMGELMGEVKPPTATAEEVEKSGLRVVKGNEIGALVQGRQVIDSSADRCLVCLSDFEEDEDCRILNCRHVFHMECVDQWIKVGRNACPACRTEAVDRKSKSDITETTSQEPNITTTRSEPDVPRAV